MTTTNHPVTPARPSKIAEDNRRLFIHGRSTDNAPGLTFPMATEQEQVEATRQFLELCLRHIGEAHKEKAPVGFATDDRFQHKHDLTFAPGTNVIRDSVLSHTTVGCFAVHLASEEDDKPVRTIRVWYGQLPVEGSFGFSCPEYKDGIPVDFSQSCIESAAELISKGFDSARTAYKYGR